ncbi:30S ribosomal protein S19e [Candidatus Woesearchaeota archaeon]|nr:30S ribosomal protein S19e [Candidatus Woesearchaeota archaeon]
MSHILVVNPEKLVRRTAEELKNKKIVQPESWSTFVKTGHSKERTPDQEDWWYYRSASILRTVARLGPIGTQKLRVKYGGRKNRGHKPERFYPASGSVIRAILQQLEKAGLIRQTQKGVHKGRVLTPEGTSFMDKVAIQMLKENKESS